MLAQIEPGDSVIATGELDRRPSRPPDFQAESEALVSLMKILKQPDANVFQALAATALHLCRAHSAGVSTLEQDKGQRVLRWHGAAGRWADRHQGTFPQAASHYVPVLARGEPLLMARPEQLFADESSDTPPLVEVLLVPFLVDGATAGTVWVVAHDATCQFELEDLRLLSSLSEFGSVSCQVLRHSAQMQDALAQERAGAQLLQAISSGLVQENEVSELYEEILKAAITIVRADFCSMHTRIRGRDELQLIAHKGFDPVSVHFWRKVHINRATPHGRAFHLGQRFAISDTEHSELQLSKLELVEYRRAGIRSLQSTPLLSPSGQLVGILSTHWRAPHEATPNELRMFDVLARLAADLLERARTDQALREADRRKDEFLAVLSHELRNPLAPLSTGLELLQRAGNDARVAENTHSIMSRQLAHLVRLVNDLLDLSRITRNKVELKRAPLDLHSVGEAAIELTRPLVNGKQHRLLLDQTDRPLPVNGDAERLTQVVGNVLGNATKYAKPGATIRLCSRVERDDAVIRIQDSGFGIPNDQLERIFEMFYQVPEHRTRQGAGGLGIGLALSRTYMELHGGSISALSDGLNSGSEFVIRLPLATPAETAAAHARDEVTTVTHPRRVLIVDDNVDAASTLASGLAAMGHIVQTEHSGTAALAVLDAFDPQILLLDIGMPGFDGYELARRIRAMPGTNDLVLIAITGWGQAADRAEAVHAGFDHHFTKPVRLDAVQSAIDALVAARGVVDDHKPTRARIAGPQ